MHRLATSCCAITIVVSVAALIWDPPSDPTVQAEPAAPAAPAALPAVSSDPEVVIVGAATAAERRRVDDAVASFRAGLGLPDVEVRFSTVPDDCLGHYGLFQEQYRPWRITICSEIGFVMLHEFGHAWERANLDVDEREAYAARRGFPTWNSLEFPREERAAEEAAFVLQQVLSRTNPPDNDRWRDITAAYDALLELADVADGV